MPDEVISDTSPLQYLHQAGCLELLRELYGTVLVPQSVVDEIAAGRARGVDLPDLDAIEWLELRPAPHREVLPLVADLGPGEREVLSLAKELEDSLCLLDDALARRFAAHLGLRFTGTLGVLLRAKKAGYLDRVSPVVSRLQALGFRLDRSTERAVLEIAGED